ncbi:malectin domain-containing carbohydrate-binding protein [Marinagarivorans algicola]|uniref:malectin domain-containing carbohydrate-binding protein n=1 Tax=Marinagarivorans algicola TaxID=1513270 RepID=UPI0006B426C0|nr:malectin domain-containing carbohydrate-binding protein [Marinagarivorans algicola]
MSSDHTFAGAGLFRRLACVGAISLLVGCAGETDTSSAPTTTPSSAAPVSSTAPVSSAPVSSAISSVASSTPSTPTLTDSDMDGVLNPSDKCPETALGESIDSNGCSSFQRGKALYASDCQVCHQADGSGAGPFPAIKDHKCTSKVQGACADVAGLATYIAGFMPTPGQCTDTNGSTCATDVSNFMVIEFAPKVVAGDRDKDGIQDAVDACPDTPEGDLKTIDHTGCKVNNGKKASVFAINVGGDAYTAKDGTKYIADAAKYYLNSLGASSGNPTHAVANTQDDVLYRKERWGSNLIYKIPLTNKGSYDVILHFAEVFHTEKGKRIMDVFIENKKVLSNYDIFDKAGGKNKAKTERINNVTVNDGMLNINAKGTTNNGSLVAINVVSLLDNDGDGDGIPDKRETCPGTKPGATVNAEGCSDQQRDKDGDGILIPDDVCPDTISSEKNTITTSGRLAGCSARVIAIDSDNDGVADVIDNCPGTSAGLSVGVTGCTGIGSGASDNLPTAAIVSPQMRLTASEYTNTIKTAFGVNNLPDATLLSDNTGPFRTYINNADDKSADFGTLVGAANLIANALATNYANKCDWNSTPNNCVRAQLTTPIEALLRLNELSTPDIQTIGGIIRASLAKGASTEQAVAAGIAFVLIDDRAIYQVEVGGNSTQSGKVKLSDREFINRLSYLLLDNTPDNNLVNSRNGIVNDSGKIDSQATRLMAKAEYKNTVFNFVAEWLGIPTKASSTNLGTLDAASLHETRLLVNHIIDNNLPLTELFTANYSFINKVLARHYGVPEPTTNWARYDFPANAKRQGILTHASFLTANGKHGRDINTIFRGKVVFERLFCDAMPPVPPAEQSVDLADQVSDRGTALACRGCHQVVDPIGRMFDLYDDYGKRFDKAELFGGLYMDVDIADDYDGAVEFAQALENSDAFKHCASRQLFRFALGRDVTKNESSSFNSVYEALQGAGTINATFSALVTSDAFKHVYSNTNTAQSCMVGS